MSAFILLAFCHIFSVLNLIINTSVMKTKERFMIRYE